MEDRDILSKVDHTNLNNCATWEEIRETIDEGISYGCASICIMPYYMKKAAAYAAGRIDIGGAIGFPRGDHLTSVKVFETEQAVKDGAKEIDMVINLCEVKAGNFDIVLDDIRAVRNACPGVLKVIVETSELTETEKIKLCQVVTESGADYIKTSTGFSKSGATLEDVKLFTKHIGPDVKIKASGGIKTREDAEKYLEAGVSRIGTKFTKDFCYG